MSFFYRTAFCVQARHMLSQFCRACVVCIIDTIITISYMFLCLLLKFEEEDSQSGSSKVWSILLKFLLSFSPLRLHAEVSLSAPRAICFCLRWFVYFLMILWAKLSHHSGDVGTRDVVIATNFMDKIGKIGLFTFIRSHGIPKRIAILRFWLNDCYLWWSDYIVCKFGELWFSNSEV